MALTANDYIKPVRTLLGMSIPMMPVTKASATTWNKGDIIIATSGLAVEAADGPTTGTIIGVAMEDASNGNTTQRICPAFPGVVFRGRICTGDAGGEYTSLVTNRYNSYGVSLEAATANVWYINAADTTDLAVYIIEFIDDIGDTYALVDFIFINTVWCKI